MVVVVVIMMVVVVMMVMVMMMVVAVMMVTVVALPTSPLPCLLRPASRLELQRREKEMGKRLLVWSQEPWRCGLADQASLPVLLQSL